MQIHTPTVVQERSGEGVGVDGNDFTFSGKPLIFLTI